MKNALRIFSLIGILVSCAPKEPVKARKTELDSLQIQQLYEKERQIKEPLFAALVQQSPQLREPRI